MGRDVRRAAIARLNDAFRNAGGGLIVLTAGIAALPNHPRGTILMAVRDFHADADDEHRVGTLAGEGQAVLWYILYHCDRGEKPDPADPDTARILVIMLEGEP